MGQLTDKMIRAATPGQTLSDDDGSRGAGRLTLTVKTNGRKVWAFRFRQGTSDQTRTIGDYPEISLSAAREQVRKIRETPEPMRRHGTLGELLEAYRLSLDGRPSQDDVRRTMNTNRAALYDKEARAITPAEISGLLHKANQRGATTSMNRLRSMLHAAYNFGAKHDLSPLRPRGASVFGITANPVTIVPKIAEFERPRSRVLTDEELAAFLAAARGRNDAIGAFLELLVVTGQRGAQLHAATREGDVLIVVDTKGRTGAAKINRLPILPEWGDLADRALLAQMGSLGNIRRAGNAVLPKDANMLDLRRTVETRLQEMGISREMRGALLSHGHGGVQARHYERAELLDQKAGVLRAWWAALARLGGESVVVPIRKLA